VQKFVVVVRPQAMIIITIYAFKMVLIVQRTSKIERERELLLHLTGGWLHMTESESLSLLPSEKTDSKPELCWQVGDSNLLNK
jgi:hypothetical protein